LKKKEDLTENMGESRPAIDEPAAPPEAGEQDSTETVHNGGQAETADNSGGEGAADTPAEAGKTAVSGEKPLTPEEKIADLEAKLAEASDNYLRKAADFENFRKRMNQEKSTAIDYANQTLLLDLVPVIDDLERAIKSAKNQREAAGTDGEQIAASYNSLYEGIGMIEKSLVSQLENRWGLKRFDSAGEPFDPNRHEAIMMEKSAEQGEPVVAEEFIKGYLLKERVIRPAKVKVLMPEK
jgi:molecular chaperone GrpE